MLYSTDDNTKFSTRICEIDKIRNLSCSNVPTDREIPKSNIAVMLSQIEERLKQNKVSWSLISIVLDCSLNFSFKARILKDPTMSQMRDLVEVCMSSVVFHGFRIPLSHIQVTMDYGLCVKQCFINKNRQQGACFDHLGLDWSLISDILWSLISSVVSPSSPETPSNRLLDDAPRQCR